MGLLWRVSASLCFVGYFPFAPGTLATLVAAFCWWFIPSAITSSFLFLFGITAFSILIAHQAEISFGKKDDRRIVLDEFVGFFWTLAFLPKKFLLIIIGFLIFRILDILKWPAINKLQRWPGGWGVVGDDVLAGIFSNIILQVIRLLFQ